MVVFTETDGVQHYFWEYLCPTAERYDLPEGREYRPALQHFLASLDAWIGKLMEEAGFDESVVVMSDYGFMAKPRRRIHAQSLARELRLFSLHRASGAGRLRVC
jgi:predicted AlkP superfamily phosphohydrolase/phosphomutase